MASESERSSLQIFENSPELIVIKDEYSVSGIERCSACNCIRLRLNSVCLPVFSFSKVIFKVLGS